MNLKKELLTNRSKENIKRIARHVIASHCFEELLVLIKQSGAPIPERASWVMSHCSDLDPTIIPPHTEVLLLELQKGVSSAVRRNILRVLQSVNIPDHLLGLAANLCFDYLAGTEPVAVKVFAMTILANICQREPDLAPELRLIIEDQLPYASPGFKNRGNKILSRLT